MKLTDFPLLTDENIDPAVVQFLRSQGFDVLDVTEAGLFSEMDDALMHLAASDGRVVVTHDSDFGTLAIHGREPVTGIVYIRPGHIDPQFTIGTLATVLEMNPDVTVPFLLVARRRGTSVTLRIRHLGD